MRRLALSGGIVLTLALGPPVRAQDVPTGLVCRVEGYDLALINNGTTPVAAGTVILWSVPFARAEGHHAFDTPLAPGGMVMLGGVLDSSYLRPGTPCQIAPGDAEP